MSDIGRVVRRGRIRVDARKAIAKLREHLLVDLHLYAVEAVRAAVLAGATFVDVTYDADDVVIAWDGAPIAADMLPRLFEHLVGEADEDTAHARLLSLAVNAALGLAPASVTLTSADQGAAARVTWTPALLAAIEREEAPLPEIEAIARPADMPARGTRLHLKRKMGWETVRRAAAKTVPREVALLIDAAHCLRLTLRVNGQPPPMPSRPKAIARASLSLPGAKHAHVEIVRGSSTPPHVEFCELGVLLTRVGFSFGARFPMADHLGVTPPVRIMIDADALPTNASRSAVREDAPLFGALQVAAAPALSDAIAGLVAAAFKKGAIPDGVTIDEDDPAALREALGAFLCVAEASIIARVALPEALRNVLDLPLFRDGLGRPLAREDLVRGAPLLVWSGDKPVPEEMAPWARQIVWPSGGLADRLLDAYEQVPPAQLAAMVQRGSERRRKLLATAPGRPHVPDDTYLVRERFAFRDGPFGGLEGEIAIASDPAAHVRNLALRVFLEGRFFEAFPIPEDTVPLPCVIALQWPQHIAPKLAYEGVEASAGLRAALAFSVRSAVLLCERFASERPRSGHPYEAPQAAALRAALATAVLAPTKMYSAQGFEMPAIADLAALVGAPVWPTTDGSFTSLGALADLVVRAGAICVAAPESEGRAADGRPVVRLPSTELEWLSACLREGVPLVRYDRALIAGAASPRARSREPIADHIAEATTKSRAPVFHLEAKGRSVAVTIGEIGSSAVWHQGIRVTHTLLDDTFGGVVIAIDDDSVVPSADWSSILHAQDPTASALAERVFASRLVDALSGDEDARRAMSTATFGSAESAKSAAKHPYSWPTSLAVLPVHVHRYLVHRAARAREDGATDEDRALAARIEALPFLTMLGDDGEPKVASLADIDRRHPADQPIPCIDLAPPFRAPRWYALVVSDGRLREALMRWSRGRLNDARPEIADRSRRARLDDHLASFGSRPRLDPKSVGARGDTAGPMIAAAPIPQRGAAGVTVALPLPDVDIAHALVEVLVEERLLFERLFTNVPIPVVARLSLVSPDSLTDHQSLSEQGEFDALQRVLTASVALALDVLERARRPRGSPSFFGDARALRLVHALVTTKARDGRLEAALRHADLRWPTVQGDERPFGELLQVDGALWGGTVAYPSWLPPKGPPTDLDRPVLHVPPTPEGSLLVGILEAIGARVRPVSDEIALLQQKRAQGEASAPRLATRPEHPRLAQDLATLAVDGAEGEIAIFSAGEPLASVSALSGETRRIPLDLAFPVRAIARVDVLTAQTVPVLSEKLSRAAVRLLLGLVVELDQLPLFVRAHLRTLTCRALSKDREPPAAVRRAPIFPDIDGAHWSLDALLEGKAGDLTCTLDPPPYPKARQEGHTLLLTRTEHLQLTRKIPILDVTEWMRRDLAAEQRLAADPMEKIEIPAEARARVFASMTIQDKRCSGEIGLLDPGAESLRGVRLSVNRRPLCTIDDAPGWPIVAALEDPALHANRWFDALEPSTRDETAARGRIRSLADRLLREATERALPPESERLATVFIDEEVPPMGPYGSTAMMRATGHLYLPRKWPVLPTLQLRIQGNALHHTGPLSIASAAIHPVLPVCGSLLITHAEDEFTRGSGFRLALAIRGGVEKHFGPMLRERAQDPEIQAYHWNLYLLGATTLGEPSSLAADGAKVPVEALSSMLREGADLWLSDVDATIEGAFPDRAVPFILRSGTPLARVLEARVPLTRLKRLGATSLEARPLEALAPPSSRPPNADTVAFDAADASHRTSRGWFGAMIDRVASLWGGDNTPRDSQSRQPATGLTAAVERALRAMRLRDEPVLYVEETTRGRLVRYDVRERAVLINIAHPAVADHVTSQSPATLRRVTLALVTAALSEVNIALDHVTDQDESQALLELLRQEAAAASSEKTSPPGA
ncbi:MAG: hypothetical protein U0441_04965 [Polyangiaceae bacterium]